VTPASRRAQWMPALPGTSSPRNGRSSRRLLREHEGVNGGLILSVSALDQWTLSGGHWRLVEITEKQATVAVCACTGEPLQHLQTHDPETIHHLCGASDPGRADCQE
jgi:hypothetical protein